MKKSSVNVGLVTFHRAYNYGAVLQCYALKTFIKENNIECNVIDYWPKFFKDIYYLQCQRSFRHPHISYSIKKFKIRKILNERNKKFEDFIENHICPTKKVFFKKEEMIESELPYDIFLTGSDQVWSSTCADFDEVFFLQFPATATKRKCSYAASFGDMSIPKKLKEEYAVRLRPFKSISVREASGKRILEDLELENININCDPTLLLAADQWRKISCYKNQKERYILVYYVTDGRSVREYAKELSNKTKLKVITIPCQIDYEGLSAFEDKKMGFNAFPECSPNEFLALFDCAEYIVTNSFHGTVFSLIFHKKFVSQLSLDTGKTNNRAKELLEKTKLLDRELGICNIDEKIDWENVDRVLEIERKKSREYLEKAFFGI